MKAALLYSPYELRIEDMPTPDVKAGYVLVKVKNTAICGTDVGIYNGKAAVKYPIVQGHESTGIVEEIGGGVTSLKRGDRVVLNSVIFCRNCLTCFSGRVNLCPNGGLMGREINGSFAEYVLVPDFNCIKIPECISYEDGTSLISLATVFQSHEKINVLPGQTIAVIGQGTAGLFHSRLGVIRGATVYAIDNVEWKLELSEKFGAVPVNFSKVDSSEVILEATGGAGVDIAIDSVGVSQTLRQAMKTVRPGGTVLSFGILPSNVDNFDGYDMYFKELKLIGSRGMTPNDFHSAIKIVEKGRVDLKPFVTHRFKFEQTKEALELVDKAGGSTLRVVVSMD